MRLLLTLPLVFLLSGCLGNFSLSDLSTGAGAAVGAGVTTLISSDPLVAVGGAVAGAVAGSAAIGEDTQSAIDHIQDLPEEERAAALKWIAVWDAVKDISHWIIGAVLAFFLIPLLIGYFMPNRRQRKLERMAFNDPNIKM